jgi:hypothetical protein
MEFRKIGVNEARDTGLAVILILLIIEFIKRPHLLTIVAMGVLVLTMIWPALFKPLARIWFGFSHVLGSVVSRVLLTVVFFVIVTPVGLIRQASGADPMKSSLWKKDLESVLVDRNHLFTKEDIEKPY